MTWTYWILNFEYLSSELFSNSIYVLRTIFQQNTKDWLNFTRTYQNSSITFNTTSTNQRTWKLNQKIPCFLESGARSLKTIKVFFLPSINSYYYDQSTKSHHISGLLICTLISENQGLQKSRSFSNLKKFRVLQT